jgi:hypothetical protein
MLYICIKIAEFEGDLPQEAKAKLLKKYGNKEVIIIDADKILDEIKLNELFNKPEK